MTKGDKVGLILVIAAIFSLLTIDAFHYFVLGGTLGPLGDQLYNTIAKVWLAWSFGRWIGKRIALYASRFD